MRQVAGKRHRGFSLQRKEAVTGWLFVTPVMIGFLVFTPSSMVYSLYISFTDWNILSDPHFVGLQNYKNLFTRDIFFWDLPLEHVLLCSCIGSVCAGHIPAVCHTAQQAGEGADRHLPRLPVPSLHYFHCGRGACMEVAAQQSVRHHQRAAANGWRCEAAQMTAG